MIHANLNAFKVLNQSSFKYDREHHLTSDQCDSFSQEIFTKYL